MPAVETFPLNAVPRSEGDSADIAGPTKPTWIGFVVFAVFVVVIACYFCVLFIRQIRTRRRDNTATIHGPASSTRGFRNTTRIYHPWAPKPSVPVDLVEVGQTYKQLRADSARSEILPDQSGSSVECVICLEQFQDESLVRTLPCHHIFHAECITSWFQKHHDTCPICMAHYVTTPRGEELPAPPPPAILPDSAARPSSQSMSG